jgi:hypothetical protein
MEDVELMELFESFNQINEDIPDGFFWHWCSLLYVACYLSCEVAVACEFHHNTV